MRQQHERVGSCVQCGACCKKTRITSVLSNILRQHGTIDDARAYYSYRGIKFADVDTRGDRVMLELDIPCDQLTADNECLSHIEGAAKPLICQKYPWFEDDIESCGYSFIKK